MKEQDYKEDNIKEDIRKEENMAKRKKPRKTTRFRSSGSYKKKKGDN